MHAMRHVVFGAIVLAWAAGEAVAETLPRTFAVPDHGSLVLDLPTDWRQSVKTAPGGPVPLITLSPAQGDDFKVLVTPMWSAKNDPNFNKPESVKRAVDAVRTQMAARAVEKEVELKEIRGLNGTGYYFVVTDKAPKPGEYTHALCASFGVGDLLLNVTVLCRSKDAPVIQATLQSLQGAKQTPAGT